MKFQTPFNAQPRGGKVFTQPSQTVPDESYTLKEILERSQRGLVDNVIRRVVYDDEPNLNEINILRRQGLDITDLDERLQKLNENLQTAKAEKDKKIREQQEEKVKQEREQLKEELLKELNEKKD